MEGFIRNIVLGVLMWLMCLLPGALGDFNVMAVITYSYQYEWLDVPPQDADTVEVYLSYLHYTDIETSKPKLKKKSMMANIYVKDDSIYFPIISIPSPTEREPVEGQYSNFVNSSGWMKGIKEEDKIKFFNQDILAEVTTTTSQPDSENPDSVIVSTQQSKIRLYGISEIGVLKESYRNTDTDFYSRTIIPISLSGADITGEFHENTDLIYNLNNGFLASRGAYSSITYSYSHYAYSEGTFTQCINAQLIPDMLTGHIFEEAPDSLPTPELSLINEIYDYHTHGWYSTTLTPKIDVRLNIVTPDKQLIDPERLFIRLWVDDEDYGSLSFNDHGNPFMHGYFYGITLPKIDNSYQDYTPYNPAVRAYCYYEKEDGTQVVSPGASLNCPSDVAQRWRDNPGEFTPEDDGIIYDLTGRRETGYYTLTGHFAGKSQADLHPGIYIERKEGKSRKIIIK